MNQLEVINIDSLEVLDIKSNKQKLDIAKNRLKTFSEKKDAEIAIKSVEENTLFFKRKVTSEEFNQTIQTIQKYLKDINHTNNSTIKEFRSIYDALDSLDTGYMQAIINNIIVLKQENKKIKENHEILEEHQNKLDIHFKNLEKNNRTLKERNEKDKNTMSLLKKFQNELQELKHLKDIDQMWFDFKKMYNEIQDISTNIANSIERINKEISDIKKQHKSVSNELKQNINILSKESQISKDKISVLSLNLSDSLKALNQQKEVIDNISLFVNVIRNIEHLNDVDYLWKQNDVINNDLKTINTDVSYLQEKYISSEKYFSEYKTEVETLFSNFDKKIKLAYWIAGGSLSFAVVSFILMIVRTI